MLGTKSGLVKAFLDILAHAVIENTERQPGNLFYIRHVPEPFVSNPCPVAIIFPKLRIGSTKVNLVGHQGFPLYWDVRPGCLLMAGVGSPLKSTAPALRVHVGDTDFHWDTGMRTQSRISGRLALMRRGAGARLG